MSSNSFEVELSLPVKTYDIDFANIVNNIVYIRWLEDLRLAMLEQYFPLSDQLNSGFVPVVLQTKIDYKQAIKLFDQPKGRMWIQDLGSLRWSVSAEITVNNRLSALAEQVGIFVNLQNNKPIRIPEQFKQKYSLSHLC